MKKLSLTLVLSFFVILWLSAQQKVQTTGELLHGLNKLKVVGSAMYVAAHPDDENTHLITWLANEKKVRTAYTSMTRGDGGQNLIGSEKGESAGLLRTHELLRARSIDGGEQYFTRANDFGYTKTTEEALATWGKEKVLSDLVYRIRKFQPDVMITRFPPDERAGHGHHSASSLLAEEAFEAAADPTAFPEQLSELSVWQAKRLLWNFYNRGFTNTPPKDKKAIFLRVDIGGYNPLLGESYGEIGSRARSSHRSQGFGAALRRGQRMETLKHTKGEPAENDLFDGIDTSWNRIKGAEKMTEMIDNVIRDFKPEEPSASVLALNQMYEMLSSLPKSSLLDYKMEQLADLIIQFSGLHLEINADSYVTTQNDSLKGNIKLINRSNLAIELQRVTIPEVNFDFGKAQKLAPNDYIQIPFKAYVNANIPITQPYWLQSEHELGSYTVENPKLRGEPLSPKPIIGKIKLNISGLVLERLIPLDYKYVEPSFGEIYRPLEVRPTVTVTPNTGSLVFNTTTAQEILVTVKSSKDAQSGELGINAPTGWTYSPISQNFNLEHKDDEQLLSFAVVPPNNASKAKLEIVATVNGQKYNRGLNSIKYRQIPESTTFPLAEVAAVKLDLKKVGERIGYIMGSGDEMPEALRQIGYEVDLLKEDDMTKNLSKYQAILIGSRAYSLYPWLAFNHSSLMEYVESGGNLICQFQTRGGYNDFHNKMGPYDFDIGRDRVSQEDAEVRFEMKESPILNSPNHITAADFEGWIQERGLYFSQNWSKEYTPILNMNDRGENEKLGSLIHARYGSGNYIYTGLSFFRELPAGVPGAYRLLANMISLK